MAKWMKSSVEAGVLEATGGEALRGRRVARATERARRPEPDIVEQDDQHVRCTGRRAHRSDRRDPRVRILRVVQDVPRIPAIGDRQDLTLSIGQTGHANLLSGAWARAWAPEPSGLAGDHASPRRVRPRRRVHAPSLPETERLIPRPCAHHRCPLTGSALATRCALRCAVTGVSSSWEPPRRSRSGRCRSSSRFRQRRREPPLSRPSRAWSRSGSRWRWGMVTWRRQAFERFGSRSPLLATRANCCSARMRQLPPHRRRRADTRGLREETLIVDRQAVTGYRQGEPRVGGPPKRWSSLSCLPPPTPRSARRW
jgi:hypothetical protein